MLIEQLRPVHAGDYRALMLEAYALHPEAFSSSVAERAALPLSWWQSRLSEEPLAQERVLGGFQDDRLAGVAGLSFESREKLRHKATLFGMYVPDRFRQQGLGRRLVQAVLAQAGARPGVRLVQLTVTQGNHAARALYESCGFVSYGVEPFAVAAGPAYVSKIHMWCNIGFPDTRLA
ncbi:GNAT family N-acetyltransferase [Polaromonas sp.]|uniref:GNAT family N-acetyltransferase n=1 Tax=Polaromonas sp. TaxID=1869339 RepID=UPI0024871552|nr:GNAT family N-acetyltransferase [Polaromonas sp.]MDI1342005.1 GNAT family N-acetyltransferase [Polaromonas sp.]